MSPQTAIQLSEASPAFQAAVPPEVQPSSQVTALATYATSEETRGQLICQNLLEGETLVKAQKEAEEVLPKILSNTQVLASYGNDALQDVNRLIDKVLKENPDVDIPELHQAMVDLDRHMRGLGRKYDPNDPKVRKKYEDLKENIMVRLHLAKNFFEEFMADVRSIEQQFDRVIAVGEGKEAECLRSVGFCDQYYLLNEQAISRLIYVTGVIELIRDKIALMASQIIVGNSNLGDRGTEEKANLSMLVTHMENKIISFKERLFFAWAMATQIRNMGSVHLGIALRTHNVLEGTIPSMKATIVVWRKMSAAEQAAHFNKAVEDMNNYVLTMFAHATEVSIPAMANALATPALSPSTIQAWVNSFSAQAEGFVQAIEKGQKNRAELEQAMVTGKQIIDASTQRVNQAQLEHVLTIAQEAPLQISRSVPA